MILSLLTEATDVDYPRPPIISPLRPSQMTGPFRYGFNSKDATASARLLLTVDPTEGSYIAMSSSRVAIQSWM